MTYRTARWKEASTTTPASAGRVDPPPVRNTLTTAAAGARRPPQHSGGPLRLLAARLIQEQLVRVGRAAQAVEGDLAALLRRLAARRMHRALGYRRLADYLEDRPGLSLVACRRLIQCDRSARTSGHSSPPPGRTVTLTATSLFPTPAGAVADPCPMGPAAGPAAAPMAAPAVAPAVDFDVWMQVTRTVREALRPLGPGTGADGPSPPATLPAPTVASRVDESGPGPGLFAAGRDDVEGVDAAVRDRVRRAQALAWRRATLLAAAARHSLHEPLGFDS